MGDTGKLRPSDIERLLDSIRGKPPSAMEADRLFWYVDDPNGASYTITVTLDYQIAESDSPKPTKG